MNVTLKRRAKFSAAHNYYLKSLSPTKNEQIFGQYVGAEGHGHNYKVEIAVAGEVDERTGMVVNITDIDYALKSEVISTLDNRFLNREVEYFFHHAPSVENIVDYVRKQLSGKLPSRATLTEITVWEMDTLWASWQLEDGQGREIETMTQLTRAYDFSASHRLHSEALSDEENVALFGKCNNPNGHGHNYEVEVTLTGAPDERSGMLFPLDELDQIVDEEVLAPLDHRHLNLDVPEFEHVNPTSEMLAVVIWRRLARRLPTEGSPRLAKVGVRETARNYFEYSGH